MISLIISLAISGLIIGALGRLLVPGPNPMGILSTILVGLLGSLIGGIIGRIIFGTRYTYAFGLSLVIAVICTAAIIYLLQKPKRL